MTTGAAYKAYYAKNAERIRAANRERMKAYREKKRAEASEDRETERKKEREAYSARKSRLAKATFTGLARTADEPLRPFFAALAARPDLHHITPKTLRWLTEIKTPPTS